VRREDADTLGDCVKTEVELTEERKETFFLSWTADDLFLDVVGDDKIEVEEICLDVPAAESMLTHLRILQACFIFPSPPKDFMSLQVTQVPQLAILQLSQVPHFFFFLALMALCWDWVNFPTMVWRLVDLHVFFILELIFFAGDNLEHEDFFFALMALCCDLVNWSTMESRFFVLLGFLTGDLFILELIFFTRDNLDDEDFFLAVFFIGDDLLMKKDDFDDVFFGDDMMQHKTLCQLLSC
jgi:hypothetical protein